MRLTLFLLLFLSSLSIHGEYEWMENLPNYIERLLSFDSSWGKYCPMTLEEVAGRESTSSDDWRETPGLYQNCLEEVCGFTEGNRSVRTQHDDNQYIAEMADLDELKQSDWGKALSEKISEYYQEKIRKLEYPEMDRETLLRMLENPEEHLNIDEDSELSFAFTVGEVMDELYDRLSDFYVQIPGTGVIVFDEQAFQELDETQQTRHLRFFKGTIEG